MEILYLFLFAVSKHPRLDIDEAVDDVLPLAIAQKFRERLKEQKTADASTSNEEGDKRKARGKKVDHLYTRSTTKFVNCLKGLTPRKGSSGRTWIRRHATLQHQRDSRVHRLLGSQLI